MKKQKLNITILSEVKDRFIGKVGTPERNQFEQDLKKDLMEESESPTSENGATNIN